MNQRWVVGVYMYLLNVPLVFLTFLLHYYTTPSIHQLAEMMKRSILLDGQYVALAVIVEKGVITAAHVVRS